MPSHGFDPLFAERPDWSDIQPISQYENADPIAPIFYSTEYRDATDYFRGIVRVGEKSERVLELTEAIIRMNPAHYSAWQYRYETLRALNSPLDIELQLMDELAVQFLKTYQVWHHRRLVLQLTRDPARELAFITCSLKADVKNYHTWSHRQWVLSFFNEDDLWRGELEFVDSMLSQDVRNNSAWHHRFFVVFQAGQGLGKQREEEGEEEEENDAEDSDSIVRRELRFVKQKIALAPNNMSAWNYLRGVLDTSDTPFSSIQDFVALYIAPAAASEEPPSQDVIIDLENPGPLEGAELPCAAAIEFMADIHEKESGQESVSKAVELWKSLADEHDTIRKKYWEFRIRKALKSLGD